MGLVSYTRLLSVTTVTSPIPVYASCRNAHVMMEDREAFHLHGDLRDIVGYDGYVCSVVAIVLGVRVGRFI
jgi:hypothetical protein